MCCYSGDGIYMRSQNCLGNGSQHTFDIHLQMSEPNHFVTEVVTLNGSRQVKLWGFMCSSKGTTGFKRLRKNWDGPTSLSEKRKWGLEVGRDPTRSPRNCCLNKVTFRLLKRSKAWALQVLKGHGETYLLRKPWFKLVDDLGGKVHFPLDIAALLPEEAKSVKGSTGLGTGCITQAWGEGNGFRLTGGLCPGLSGQPRWASQTSNCALKANLPSLPKLKAGSHLLAASVR